jgi:hypothetical protein
MVRNFTYAAFLVCVFVGGRAVAQETVAPGNDYEGGVVKYVNAGALEVGINRKLFKLDSRFRIHGLGGNDRVEQLRNLGPGMGVQYSISGHTPGYAGVIRELWVQPD